LSIGNTLVLGIGNRLLTDEGAGIHALELLAREHRDSTGITYLDGGTLSFTLAEPIAAHENLIVIDAARFGGVPGAVRCFEGFEMTTYLKGTRKSAHEVGLVDLLDIARLSETLPRRMALVGIEPAELGWGERPSEPVGRALPDVARTVRGIVARWTRNGSGHGSQALDPKANPAADTRLS
jgi:hydrogenase maturation protease